MPLSQRPSMRLFGSLLLIWLLLNLPVLLGLRALPWDAINQFYPTVYFNASSLRHGLAPWWNPSIYSGYPQLADPQGMLFSPLLMGWMLLRSNPSAAWFAWGVLLHLLMGGAAMLAGLRRSGANAFGALVGAVVFMAGGVAAARLEHTPIVLAYAYAPVAWLALRYFMASPNWRRGLCFGLASGALITQLVQLTCLLVLMIVLYAIVATIAHWRRYSAADRWQWCAGMGVALLVALAMGLPQLLLSWAYINLSNRAVLPLDAAAAGSLDSRALLSLFDPNVWHALRGQYNGPASRVEGYLYLGAVPSLLLVGIGIAWKQPQQRRQLIFFGVVAVFASLYMFGVNTPFYGWLYSWLPGMQQFRRPSDAAYLLNMAFAVFIGLAASHVDLHARRRVLWLLAMAAVWLGLSSLHMRDVGIRWQSATILAVVLACIALWHVGRFPTTARHHMLWLLVLLLADYRCFNLNGSFNQARDQAHSFMRDEAVNRLAQQLKPTPGALPQRIETIDAGVYWDNLVVLRGLSSTQGYNPLRYALYDQWYGARDNGSLPRVNTAFNPAADSALSALLSVGYLVRGLKEHAAAWSPPRGYQLSFASQQVEVWRNTQAYPRLLTPTTARLQNDASPVSAEDFSATDFRETVWLTPRDDQDRLAAETSMLHCGHRLRLLDSRATPTQLTVRTLASEGPGWLVLSELDFPGWKATSDGLTLPIHRANGMFRAVCVPAGEHTMQFTFHPWAMVAQAWQRAQH
ncbi:YfhO family protein [Dyella silvatica]|uniref:YfhO family protein n=1 Tax=Dyella silvatica TaxID=2992128 RepID=UPI002254EF01|nr:YfhO family protein [Dyella silvatica]